MLFPNYTNLKGTSKLHVIQSIVSSLLVEDIFGHYFCGLPAERVTQCQRMEEYLASIGKH